MGGMGGSAGTGGMGGMGGMLPSTETDCFDGLDDDGDGNTDCADFDCNPVAKCVPPVPAGWIGHTILFDGAPAQDPGCPADYPADLFQGGKNLGGNASCSPCLCGAPTGIGCSWAQNPNAPDGVLSKQEPYTSDSPCGSNPGCLGELSIPSSWNGFCLGTGAPNGPDKGWAADTTCGPGSGCTMGSSPCNASVRLDVPPTAAGGTCLASGGTITKSAAFAGKAHACGSPADQGGGCLAQQACLPRPTGAFVPGMCVYKPGDQACPGSFPNKFLYYETFADNRTCSACGCGSPSGASCDATITIWGTDGCSTQGLGTLSFSANDPPVTCVDMPGLVAVEAWSGTTSITGGQCTSTGGQVQGSLTPQNATTFCCVL